VHAQLFGTALIPKTNFVQPKHISFILRYRFNEFNVASQSRTSSRA